MGQKLTEQQYYDLLAKSAQDGTFPSIVKERTGPVRCKYRQDHTASCKQRCAAGLLIPDELYRVDMEGASACWIPDLIPFIPDGMDNDDVTAIQEFHDAVAKSESGWNAAEFVDHINNLPCFSGVQQVSLIAAEQPA